MAYNWYYAAGVYLKHGAGQGRSPAEWQELIEGLASSLADRLRAGGRSRGCVCFGRLG